VTDPQARTPTPPAIPGYEYLRDLGAGGYSVVYLYRQASLNREVAVKVLRDFDLDDVVRERFTAEATAMVQLGNHPNIVDVLDTGIASDGSRYLIMRYYAGGNLAQRVAGRGLPVAEVVDIGLKLVDAVKTVHAAHLVHRDIKPSNVLIDDVNHNYRLSDFGIAGRLVYGHASDAFGISVPWSAPEIIRGETGGSVAADVYSLGATLWHLLVGQSPYRLADGDNTRPALEARIRAGSLPPMPRADVPPALTDLLIRMMSGIWHVRPALTDVAADLAAIASGSSAVQYTPPLGYQVAGYQPDDVEQTNGRAGARRSNPADLTVAGYHRPPSEARLNTTAPGQDTFSSGTPSSSRGTATNGVVGVSGGGGSVGGALSYGDGSGYSDGAIEADGSAGSGRRWLVPTLIGAGVLAAAIGFAVVSGGGGSTPSGNASATSSPGAGVPQDPGQIGEAEPPGAVTVSAVRSSPTTLKFTWSYSAELANDTYKWQTSDGTKSGVVTSPALTLPDPTGVQLCVEVKVVRADGSNAAVDWSQAGCGQ